MIGVDVSWSDSWRTPHCKQQKCDGVRPRCGRCKDRNLPCFSQAVAPRRARRLESLQTKALGLEARFASLSGDQHQDSLWQCVLDHSRSLAPHRTKENRPCGAASPSPYPISPNTPLAYATLNVPQLLPPDNVPLFPLQFLPRTILGLQTSQRGLPGERLGAGNRPIISIDALDALFAKWDPMRGPIPHELAVTLYVSLCLLHAGSCY